MSMPDPSARSARSRIALLALAGALVTGCATGDRRVDSALGFPDPGRSDAPGPALIVQSDPSLIQGSFVLVEIDGQGVQQMGLALAFIRDGTYRAVYDCGEQFGNYALGPRLTFFNQSPTTGECVLPPPEDGRTKRLLAARDALLYDRHQVERQNDGLVLRSRRHVYRLERN